MKKLHNEGVVLLIDKFLPRVRKIVCNSIYVLTSQGLKVLQSDR